MPREFNLRPISHVIELEDVQPKPIITEPPLERIAGRMVRAWCPHCGSYGMGGPGFFGLRLEKRNSYPREWLILRLWGATHWITVNNRHWLAAPGKLTSDMPQRPLTHGIIGVPHIETPGRPLMYRIVAADKEEFPPEIFGWDDFGPLILGRNIMGFDVEKHTMEMLIGDTRLSILRDPASRPRNLAGEELTLWPEDDLRTAWILSPTAMVLIKGYTPM